MANPPNLQKPGPQTDHSTHTTATIDPESPYGQAIRDYYKADLVAGNNVGALGVKELKNIRKP